jgi:hypothetical protein
VSRTRRWVCLATLATTVLCRTSARCSRTSRARPRMVVTYCARVSTNARRTLSWRRRSCRCGEQVPRVECPAFHCQRHDFRIDAVILSAMVSTPISRLRVASNSTSLPHSVRVA